MQQRAQSDSQRLSIHDLAADVWDAAELEDASPLREWIERFPGANSTVIIPEDRPASVSINPLFAPNRVYFGKRYENHMDYQSREQAELVVRLAHLGICGQLKLPENPKLCGRLFDLIDERLRQTRALFEELAKSRTSDDRVRGQVIGLLLQWFMLGREIEERSVLEGEAGQVP
jgi:hypothetical protein